MKFKIDENLPAELADVLRTAGHDVHSVHDEGMEGESDLRIAEVCKSEERVLITLDMDFSDLREFSPEDFPGIIVFRLRKQDKLTVASVGKRILPLFDVEDPAGKIWIVDESRVRIRGES